jgi:hypothetical protein
MSDKLSDRFVIQEYVSEQVYNKYGHRAKRFICKTLVSATTQLVIDLEAKYCRPVSCTINSWKWGGSRVASGLRMIGTHYYSITSAHAWGKGDDKQFAFKDGDKETIPTVEVYDFILENQEKYYDLGIRRMEHIKDATSWIHWDTIWTNYPEGRIQIVRA